MSEKPEWFELAGEDQTPEKPVAKSKKRLLKLAAFTAPLVLVGGAMVFADGHDEEERPNIDTTISTSTSQSSNVSESQVTPQVKNVPTSQNGAVSAKEINSPTTAPKKPGISAPSATNDDNHEGFSGEREHQDGVEREHHERGEHGDRNGQAPKIPQSGTSTTKN